jgi:hypothetical protein
MLRRVCDTQAALRAAFTFDTLAPVPYLMGQTGPQEAAAPQFEFERAAP